MSPRVGLSIVFKRLLTVILLATIFGFSTVVLVFFALRGRTVEVPNVIGKAEADAETELSDVGLRLKVISRAYSDKVPVNTVSDQSPVPGTTVKTGQQVRVTLSLGAPMPAPQGN